MFDSSSSSGGNGHGRLPHNTNTAPFPPVGPEGVDVGEAQMENGLLHIDLNRAVPEKVVQTINIKKG